MRNCENVHFFELKLFSNQNNFKLDIRFMCNTIYIVQCTHNILYHSMYCNNKAFDYWSNKTICFFLLASETVVN